AVPIARARRAARRLGRAEPRLRRVRALRSVLGGEAPRLGRRGRGAARRGGGRPRHGLRRGRDAPRRLRGRGLERRDARRAPRRARADHAAHSTSSKSRLFPALSPVEGSRTTTSMRYGPGSWPARFAVTYWKRARPGTSSTRDTSIAGSFLLPATHFTKN